MNACNIQSLIFYQIVTPYLHLASRSIKKCSRPGTVDLRVGISQFHCTPMIDSISHISNKNFSILYIWRNTVVYLCRRTVKYVTLEVTSDVLKLSKENDVKRLMFPQYSKRLPALNIGFPLP